MNYNFDTEISKSIFKRKYMIEGETGFNEPVERLISVVVKYYPGLEKELREALFKKWLSPAGGMWRSAMNPRKTSAINCTTLDQPDDSLESIADGWYWWAKFAAYGQGEGVDLSKLRPRNSKVHNSAESSTGAVSFMSSFDAILDTIAQQGRRGASLISLNISHPDIEEFITVKDEEGILETANISIHITDDFMEAVRNKEKWELFFETKYEKISKEVDASELFNFICEHAWTSGDPGLQFIDVARKYSNSDYLGYPVISTNAPVPGYTMVPTKDGIKPIKELYEQEEAIVIYNNIAEQNNEYFKSTYCEKGIRHNNEAYPISATFNKYPDQKKYKIYLKNGRLLESNGEHKWLTNYGMVEAKNIEEGNKIFYNEIGASQVFNLEKDENSESFLDGALVGWLVGDGWLGNNYVSNSNSLTEHKNVGIIWKDGEERIIDVFLKKHEEITGNKLNYFKDRKTSYYYRTSSEKFYNYLKENFGFDQDKYVVPSRVWTDYNFATGYLSALFDADGSIDIKEYKTRNRGCRVALTSSNLNLLENVQSLLINWYGINSSINVRSTNKGVPYTLANGEKKVSNFKTSYNLTFSRSEHIIAFKKYIDFFHNEKKEKLDIATEFCNTVTPNKYHAIEVSKVEETNEYEDMYCAVVPDKHAFVCNGMISSNCSEQFLDAHNVCLLSSVNLAKFHEYGWEGYKKLVRLGTYFLDAFRRYEIDEERSPSPIQREKLVKLPRIGLGVTGLADYFIDNQIIYASEESIPEVRKLFSLLSGESYKASYEIAKKDGHSFEYYDKEKYKQSPFVQRLLSEGFIEDYHLDYQAHVCKTTVAPNGTATEIMEAGGGGIEPIFAKYFTRRERATTNDWKEWYVFNHAVRKALDQAGLEYTKENAEEVTKDKWWTTAHEVNNINKINMMSVIQEYIDSAISVTYNLPENASVQEIKDIYQHAWKKELKGVAVYREGSKQGVLVTDSEKSKNDKVEKTSLNAIKRPKVLPCDIFEMQVDKRRVIALVGLLDGTPYEVFLTDDPDEVISVKHAKEGIIDKVETGRYDLVVNGKRSKYILEDISTVFDEEWGTLGRMVSMSLRHNVPLQFIVNQLNKVSGFGTFSKGMARVLKKYIEDGENVLAGDNGCPECGEKLIYKEGCVMCPHCLYSKCD